MQSRLLAVLTGDDRDVGMNLAFLILASTGSMPPVSEPITFNALQQRDIACVAVIALVAEQQRRGVEIDTSIIDVRESGKRWAALVGNRIIDETAAPRELVGLAMTEAAKAEQVAALASSNPKKQYVDRFNLCVPLMQADLLANAPLPKPVPSK
jgi:hypothetical protein